MALQRLETIRKNILKLIRCWIQLAFLLLSKRSKKLTQGRLPELPGKQSKKLNHEIFMRYLMISDLKCL